MNSGVWAEIAAGTTAVDNIAVDAGDVITLRVKGTTAPVKTITVALTDIEPATILTTPAISESGANDITGLTDGVVYEVRSTPSAGTASDWTTFTADSDGEIKAAVHGKTWVAGTVEVRIKATAKQPASVAKSITIS